MRVHHVSGCFFDACSNNQIILERYYRIGNAANKASTLNSEPDLTMCHTAYHQDQTRKYLFHILHNFSIVYTKKIVCCTRMNARSWLLQIR
jgi:hypothetical protein